MKRNYRILFIIIFLIAILVRVIDWPNAISQVNCDEMMTAINAKAIADTGCDTNGTSFPVYLEAWGGMGQSVMLVYLMALCIKIFGYSLAAVRLPMLLISLLSLVVFYDLVKRFSKSQKVACIAMAFLAIMPWHMLQSIWSIDCNMFPHFVLFAMYFLYRGMTEKKWWCYISMLFFALSMYAYGPAIYFVPIFLLICAIYFMIKKKLTVKQLIICIFIYLLVSGPLLTMYIINFLKIENDIKIGAITIQYFENNARTSDMLPFSENIGMQFIKNLQKLLLVFVGQYDGMEWNATPWFGTIYQISFVFVIIAIIHLVRTRKENKDIGIFMLITWFIVSLLLGILINDTNINRLNVIWYAMILMALYGMYVTYQKVKHKKAFVGIIITIYTVLFVSYQLYFFLYHRQKIDMSGCFSRGYIDAVRYIDQLPQEDLYYANLMPDGTLDIYIQFQTQIDGKTVKKISEKEEFWQKIEQIGEDEAYILYEKDKEKLPLESVMVKEFNEYIVVTKKQEP